MPILLNLFCLLRELQNRFHGTHQGTYNFKTASSNAVKTCTHISSSSLVLSFHQESYVCQIVSSQCLAQPMAMTLAVVRSWGEQAVSVMGQTSRCCMVCVMPQSHVSCYKSNRRHIHEETYTSVFSFVEY